MIGDSVQRLDGTSAVIALDGWNDAGEAATKAAKSLLEHGQYDVAFEVDPEAYFDYQYTRPVAAISGEGERTLVWPNVRVWVPQQPDLPIVVVGTEPARRWQHLTADLLECLASHNVANVVLLGSMLADAPHTRPITITMTSEQTDVRALVACERSRYEGPVGALAVCAQDAAAAGMRTVSLWASVPHYLPGNAQAPKATLALLERLAHVIHTPPLPEELQREAARWEASLDAAVADDDDLREYVAQLEQARDAWDSPAASGDAIAQEFERFLRRDEGGNGKRPHSG